MRKSRKNHLCLAMLAVVLAGPGIPGLAAVITVNDTADVVAPGNGECTLREALDNANLLAGGDTTAGDCVAGSAGQDTIELPPGTYRVTLAPANEDLNVAGDFDVLDSLVLAGPSPDLTVIDADGVDRVLDVDPAGAGMNVEIYGLSLTGGFLAAPSDGGGVRIGSPAIVTMQEVEIRNNIAERGGGVYNEGELFATVTGLRSNRAEFAGDGGGLYNANRAELTDAIVLANSADGSGGGVYNMGSLTVLQSGFDFDAAGVHGGAIFNAGSANIQFTTFGVCEAVLDGGAIHHAGPSMFIQDSQFQSNSAQANGGAIHSAGFMQLIRANILGNVAFMNGGGINHTLSSLILTDSDVEQNQAGEDGGGVANSATLQVIASRLRTNSAVRGGGVYNTNNSIFNLSAFFGNFANHGGGIYNELFTAVGSSEMSLNQALRGGGIFVAPAALTNFVNSTLSDNVAQDLGGALYVEGTAQIDFATLTQNVGAQGGGIFNNNDVSLKNSIVADNNSQDCEGLAINSFGYNIDGDNTCGLGLGPGDLSGVNPNLGPLQPNGGLTQTHALLLPSLAIDSADPDCETQFATILTEDQRQVARPVDGDGNAVAVCDRGAFEATLPSGPQPPVPNGIFGSPLTVDKLTPAGVDLEVTWDISLCPSSGYHLIHGDLDLVSTYAVGGSQCGLNTSGIDVWFGTPTTSQWFLIVADDAVQTEGSWGDASAGVRNGPAPSLQCGMVARDNSGTCP